MMLEKKTEVLPAALASRAPKQREGAVSIAQLLPGGGSGLDDGEGELGLPGAKGAAAMEILPEDFERRPVRIRPRSTKGCSNPSPTAWAQN